MDRERERDDSAATDSLQLQNFIYTIKQNMNPFDSIELDKNLLYNINTGRATSNEVADFLLNVESTGNSVRVIFIF